MPITFSLANEAYLRTTVGQAIALDQLKSVASQDSSSTAVKKIADAVKGGISKLASPALNTKNMLFVMVSVQGIHPGGDTYQELLLMLDGSYYLVWVNRPVAKPATTVKYVGQSIEDDWKLERIKTLTAVAADKILEASNKANATYAADQHAAGMVAQGFAPGHVPITKRRAPPAAINMVDHQISSPAPTQLNQGLATQISQTGELYAVR